MQNEKMVTQLEEVIDSFIQIIGIIIDNIYTEKIQENTTLLIELIEGMNSIRSFFESMFNIKTQEIDEKFMNITIAFENKDYVLIGDLLEYELMPLLLNVKEYIKKGKTEQ